MERQLETLARCDAPVRFVLDVLVNNGLGVT